MNTKNNERKTLHDEEYKGYLITTLGDFDCQFGIDRVRLWTYATKVNGTEEPQMRHSVVYKEDYVPKFLFFKKPNPVSFRERVLIAVKEDVEMYKGLIDANERNKEVTKDLLDSLDKL